MSKWQGGEGDGMGKKRKEIPRLKSQVFSVFCLVFSTFTHFLSLDLFGMNFVAVCKHFSNI